MIKFLKIISNSFKSDLCMYFTYIVGGSSIPNGKYFKGFVSGNSIIYDVKTTLFQREKNGKKFLFFSLSHDEFPEKCHSQHEYIRLEKN